jgi:hypothetical protein
MNYPNIQGNYFKQLTVSESLDAPNLWERSPNWCKSHEMGTAAALKTLITASLTVFHLLGKNRRRK